MAPGAVHWRILHTQNNRRRTQRNVQQNFLKGGLEWGKLPRVRGASLASTT